MTPVAIDKMKSKLFTVPEIRARLAKTEPLSEATLAAGGTTHPVIAYGEDWAKTGLTDPAAVTLTVPGGEKFRLTKQGALELGSECRITRGYQEAIPANLLQENVNWWLKTGLGDKQLKLLTSGTHHQDGEELPIAVAMCRATISPFSNLRLLDEMLEGIKRVYGAGEVLVDYKFHHDLEYTAFRLIVPGEHRIIANERTADDTWSTGLQVKNSLIGLKQTELAGYMFRWVCTNGQIDVSHSTGGFARRGTTPEEAYAWAAENVDEVLGGLESSLDNVQELTTQPVEGAVVTVLTDLFNQYRIPVREQHRVINDMADTGGELTMYDLANAVTRAANLTDLPYRAVERLMTMGGRIAHAMGGRCESCHRLLPEGWDQAAEPHAAVAVAS